MKYAFRVVGDGIFTRNPVFVMLLGMCPVLAVSTSLLNALGMGATVTAVLILSNSFISLLRKVIPDKIRIVSYVIVIAGFVTVADMLLKALFPAISRSLGMFIPLIVVNCIVLARAEAFASKHGVFLSALDGLSMGLGFTLALTILSVIRELLGHGELMGVRVLPDAFPDIVMLGLPAGGFLTLGVLIALIQRVSGRKGERP
ncbi:MAG: electron transport complex subunit RsxE [Oscillospiraceae bacterium]|jgi:electron transport complex protein RnfE|nr:electron transport complex subunit RsxE [Oscillospiraceae bacterium]